MNERGEWSGPVPSRWSRSLQAKNHAMRPWLGDRIGRLVIIGFLPRDWRSWYRVQCSDCKRDWLVESWRLRTGTKRQIEQAATCACIPPMQLEERGPYIVYRSYRNGAKKNGREFTLSPDLFRDLTAERCYYCGAEPSNTYRTARETYHYNGLDRVNSSGGYTPDNVVPCCWTCNRTKLARDQSEFIAWIKRTATYLLENNR